MNAICDKDISTWWLNEINLVIIVIWFALVWIIRHAFTAAFVFVGLYSTSTDAGSPLQLLVAFLFSLLISRSLALLASHTNTKVESHEKGTRAE